MRWARSWRAGAPDDSNKIIHAIYRLAGGSSMIDLGCRSANYTKDLQGAWVDIDPQPDSPPEILQMDIFDSIEFFTARNQLFNVAILTDVIEHFSKEDGVRLLKEVSKIAESCLLFTPTGELWVSDNPGPHSHRSGWNPEDLWVAGWVIWEWPTFHRFQEADIHGAFWAWKWFTSERTPLVEQVSTEASVTI